MQFKICEANGGGKLLCDFGTYKPSTKAYLNGDEQLPWSIDLNSIEDLSNLLNEVGDIIIEKDKITIYNDFVE